MVAVETLLRYMHCIVLLYGIINVWQVNQKQGEQIYKAVAIRINWIPIFYTIHRVFLPLCPAMKLAENEILLLMFTLRDRSPVKTQQF